MKKVSFVVDKLYHNNILFDRKQTSIVARDDIFEEYYQLYDEFYKYGYKIATNDIHTVDSSDIVIYQDMPKKLPSKKDRQKSFLIMKESRLIRADSFDKDKHAYFHKIFTWDDNLVDSLKYFKINYAFKIPENIPKNIKKKKLCCLIAGNKKVNHPNELYSERIKIIRWFESNHPNDFDLYGIGWNEYTFRGVKLIRAFNKIPVATKIMYQYFGEHYPSYKGKIDNKFTTMQDYRFAICYENIKNSSGYITEKIIDAMIAGCVPIYLGADNITEYIPKECFIDKRDFESDENLYHAIKNISDDAYTNYLNNIEQFFNSDQSYQFSTECFVKQIVSNIIGKKDGKENIN